MRRPQTKVVYDDNSDEEDDNISYRSEEDELLNENRSSGLEEEALGNDSDYLEELPEEDDASYGTESSFRSHSTHGSTPGTGTRWPYPPPQGSSRARVCSHGAAARIVQNGAALGLCLPAGTRCSLRSAQGRLRQIRHFSQTIWTIIGKI